MNKGIALACLFFAGYGAFAQAPFPNPLAEDYMLVVDRFQRATLASAPHDLVKPAELAAARLEPPYSLEALRSLALSSNPTLEVTLRGIQIAQAEIRGAKARRLPTLDASTGGAYIANPMDAISIPAGAFGGGLPLSEIVLMSAGANFNYDFKLVGNLPVFTWGKLKLGVSLAEQGLAAANLQYRKAMKELDIRVRGLAEGLACVQESIRALELQARIGERVVQLAVDSQAAGFITKAELLDARIKLKEVDLALARVVSQRDKLLSDLAREVGLPSLGMDQLSLGTPGVSPAPWREDEAYGLVERGSYDLALMEAQVDAKAGLARMAELKAKAFPDLGLRLELAYGGPRFPVLEQGWADKDDYRFIVSLGTSGPLFGSAVNAGEAAKARAEALQAVDLQDDAKRSLRAFVRETYLSLDLDLARLEYANLKLDASNAVLGQQRAVLELGAGSESDYLSSMMEALGELASAWGDLAGYRSTLLSLEAAAGTASDD